MTKLDEAVNTLVDRCQEMAIEIERVEDNDIVFLGTKFYIRLFYNLKYARWSYVIYKDDVKYHSYKKYHSDVSIVLRKVMRLKRDETL